jgi:hemerythrin
MRHWASTIPGVQFLEVCVESEAVALNFHQNFEFGDNPVDAKDDDDAEPIVMNGWIPSRHYMPVGFGQLGCSGFVICDANGNFVNKKTAAYLQYGHDAFRHVESILAGLLVEMDGEKRAKGEAPTSTTMERAIPSVSSTTTPSKDMESKKRKKSTEKDKVTTSRGSSPTSVLAVEAPSSVGVEAMDDEHQICTDSFNRALKDPTLETLQEVFFVLRSHFAHEEELIVRYVLTSPEQLTSPFSPFTSHRKDHHRMLAIATSELARVCNQQSSCSMVNGAKV